MLHNKISWHFQIGSCLSTNTNSELQWTIYRKRNAVMNTLLSRTRLYWVMYQCHSHDLVSFPDHDRTHTDSRSGNQTMYLVWFPDTRVSMLWQQLLKWRCNVIPFPLCVLRSLVRGMRNFLLKDTIYGLRDVFMYAEMEAEKRAELVTWKSGKCLGMEWNGLSTYHMYAD